MERIGSLRAQEGRREPARRSWLRIGPGLGYLTATNTAPADQPTPSQLGRDSSSPRNRTPKSATSTTLSCRSADLRRVANLERPEVADPGGARCQARQNQEGDGAIGIVPGVCQLPVPVRDGQRHQDDDGAQEGREVRVDILDADLGQDGGERGEECREQSPYLPRCHHYPWDPLQRAASGRYAPKAFWPRPWRQDSVKG